MSVAMVAPTHGLVKPAIEAPPVTAISEPEAGPQHLAGQTPGRWPGEGGVLGKLLRRALPHWCSRTRLPLTEESWP